MNQARKVQPVNVEKNEILQMNGFLRTDSL